MKVKKTLAVLGAASAITGGMIASDTSVSGAGVLLFGKNTTYKSGIGTPVFFDTSRAHSTRRANWASRAACSSSLSVMADEIIHSIDESIDTIFGRHAFFDILQPTIYLLQIGKEFIKLVVFHSPIIH